MHRPETHLELVRARHSDLLRQARAGELAVRMGAARHEERRSLLRRLREREASGTASAAHSR